MARAGGAPCGVSFQKPAQWVVASVSDERRAGGTCSFDVAPRATQSVKLTKSPVSSVFVSVLPGTLKSYASNADGTWSFANGGGDVVELRSYGMRVLIGTIEVVGFRATDPTYSVYMAYLDSGDGRILQAQTQSGFGDRLLFTKFVKGIRLAPPAHDRTAQPRFAVARDQDRRPVPPIMPAPRTIQLSPQLALSYVDVGDRRATEVVVLVPGLSDSWRSYERVLPHLPASIRAIAISPRGHGDSDKPQTNYAVRDYAADLRLLFDALALPRAVVAGHSSASLVARRFALDHPERVAGLVLEGSFVKVGDHAAAVGAGLAALKDPIAREFVGEFVRGTFVRPVPGAYVEAMIEESLKVPARVWRETFASMLAFNDSAELAALRVPALIVWGDRDAIIDREATETLARSIRSSSLVTFEGVGHTPHWEDPERFAREVAAFVEHCARR
jgi:pimeloyl-ACP methyl ester carboxylesterase